ncbi:MAG: hypothetical protein F4X72_00935 [Dehalococcoidia bacterium]|nr:hypothetical protein [Dehalococcoidia bacterium]
MDAGIDMVLDTVRTLTRDNDGVVIDPLDFEDGVLRIRYYEGENEECPECVMQPDSFREMVERMCSVQAPHVASVVLVAAR